MGMRGGHRRDGAQLQINSSVVFGSLLGREANQRNNSFTVE